MSENPYEAPQPEDSASPPDHIVGSSEEIRSMHLKHEAAVRSIGLFYYVCGGIVMILPIAIIAEDIARGLTSNDWGAVAFLCGIALLPIAAATGLRRLMPWGRRTGIVLGAIGLLVFPLGTIVGAYIIYLLMRSKNTSIFSREYREIVAMTPQMKPKTSLFIWLLFAIVFILLTCIGVLSKLTD